MNKALVFLGLVTLVTLIPATRSTPLINIASKISAKVSADLSNGAEVIGDIVAEGGKKVDKVLNDGVAKVKQAKENFDEWLAKLIADAKAAFAKAKDDADKTGEAMEVARDEAIAKAEAAIAAIAKKLDNSEAAATFKQINERIEELKETIKAKSNDAYDAFLDKSSAFWKDVSDKLVEAYEKYDEINKAIPDIVEQIKTYTDDIVKRAKKAHDDALIHDMEEGIDYHINCLKDVDMRLKNGKLNGEDAIKELIAGGGDLHNKANVYNSFTTGPLQTDSKNMVNAISKCVDEFHAIGNAYQSGDIKQLDAFQSNLDESIKKIIETFANVSKGSEELKTKFDKLINSLKDTLNVIAEEGKKKLNTDVPVSSADDESIQAIKGVIDEHAKNLTDLNEKLKNGEVKPYNAIAILSIGGNNLQKDADEYSNKVDGPLKKDAELINNDIAIYVNLIKDSFNAFQSDNTETMDDFLANADKSLKETLDGFSNLSEGSKDLKSSLENLVDKLGKTFKTIVEEAKKDLNADSKPLTVDEWVQSLQAVFDYQIKALKDLIDRRHSGEIDNDRTFYELGIGASNFGKETNKLITNTPKPVEEDGKLISKAIEAPSTIIKDLNDAIQSKDAKTLDDFKLAADKTLDELIATTPNVSKEVESLIPLFKQTNEHLKELVDDIIEEARKNLNTDDKAAADVSVGA